MDEINFPPKFKLIIIPQELPKYSETDRAFIMTALETIYPKNITPDDFKKMVLPLPGHRKISKET
ncbi:MAG: hypothetical protein ABFD76_05005 [Smithella sp.]